MRHLETQSQKGFYMGPGSGPSMDRVFLKNGGTGADKQFRHVLVPPAFAQQHAMRMHLAVEHYPPPRYEKGTHEEERMGTVFDAAMRDVGEHDAYDDEPFMEELAGLDMFDSIRAAPPDPKGEAVAVRGDNIPWDCGEQPALGHRHNDMSQTLHSHHVHPLPPGTKSPPSQVDSAMLISRRRNRNTPEVSKDIFNYVTDQAHAETFGGLPYGVVVCRGRTNSTSMAMLLLTRVQQRCQVQRDIVTEALLSFRKLMTSTCRTPSKWCAT